MSEARGTADPSAATLAAPEGGGTTLAADGEDAIACPSGPAMPSRYRDLGAIASGGCGDVRRALDTQLGRVVAIKVLRWEYVDSEAMRARFLVEAEVTAQLEHPGIVAVHERGELPDGRLWFTMKEVRGRTLRAVIDEVHGASGPEGFRRAPSGWTFRRLVDAIARVAQAVGFAHGRGVVHRDLKPDNVMVGEYGEVLVMDWGLARRTGDGETRARAGTVELEGGDPDRLTRVGDVLGTPAYMPPEQARGEHDRHGPESDVYSLGAILYHLLTGQRPHGGHGIGALRQVLAGPPVPVLEAAHGGPTVPAELATICERAMARAIEARYPDAGAMAEEVVAWLDGARRREQALSIVERVRGIEPVIAELRARKDELASEARRRLETTRPFDPVEAKAPAWALEDEAERLGREAALRETEWLEGMHGALSVEPDLAEAHASLSEHYKARLLEAERASRAEDAIRFEALLRAHDRGRYAALLRGEGALSLVTNPPGALVTLYRYVEEERRLVPRLVEEMGPTPILEKPLSKGSYLCVIRAEGRAVVRYPVWIERGGHWDGVPPGGAEPAPVPLPREGEIGPDEIYVPAGFCWTGGDPDASDSLPSRRLWIDGFVMGRFHVTAGEYLDFLNDLVATGREVEALRACPRQRAAKAEDEEAPLAFSRTPDGGFALPEGSSPALPAVLMDWHAASLYARWRGERASRPMRLPNELEREKAARGVDGRRAPWGHHLDATFTCALESHRGPPDRVTIDAYPADESPYGVRGLAGNVREWCVNRWKLEGPLVEGGRVRIDPAAPEDPDFRGVRGGTWGSSIVNSRSAARFGSRPETRWLGVGVRLVRSYEGFDEAL